MRGARIVLPLLAALLCFGWGAASSAEVDQVENIRVSFNADFAPRELPRLRPAPIQVKIEGNIATTDGTHPPALRRLEVSLHRSGKLYNKGLPTCSAPLLQSTDARTAMNRCGGALVGTGSFSADVTLGREVPATGTIRAFNSRKNGKRALLLHLFAAVPVRFTLVVPLEIGHRQDGPFGTVLRADVPKLGGGLGSITEIGLTIGRRYSFAGKRRSYASAACAAPASLPGGVFTFARASFRFEAHREIRMKVIQDCAVR
jgi:hypothetical protein